MGSLQNVSPLRLAALAFAAVFVLIGTALLWDANSDVPTPSRHGNAWVIFGFWIVVALCVAACFLQHDIFTVWALGATFMLVVSHAGTNAASFANINLCRVNNQDSSSRTSVTKRCTAGGIMVYMGLLACLATLVRISEPLIISMPQKLVSVVAALFGVLGAVLLWSSDSAGLGTAAYFPVQDGAVQTLLLLGFMAIAMLNKNDWTASFNAFYQAYFFIRIFLDMFVAASSNPSDEDQIYAGFLFCWFAAMCSIAISFMANWTPAPKPEVAEEPADTNNVATSV